MTLDEYQIKTMETAIYPKVGEHGYVYPALGLCGEAGEVAEKVKKVIRDRKGVFSRADIDAVKKELGDVLWYTARLAAELGLSLGDIATDNLAKLEARYTKNKITGSGDNR